MLGVLLWNIFCDPVLTLKYPEGVEALVVTVANRLELQERSNNAIELTRRWVELNELEVKIEVTVLSAEWNRRKVCFELDFQKITPTKAMR